MATCSGRDFELNTASFRRDEIQSNGVQCSEWLQFGVVYMRFKRALTPRAEQIVSGEQAGWATRFFNHFKLISTFSMVGWLSGSRKHDAWSMPHWNQLSLLSNRIECILPSKRQWKSVHKSAPIHFLFLYAHIFWFQTLWAFVGMSSDLLHYLPLLALLLAVSEMS